ncbi:MXAN_5187 C-terminal domain-containing protein [Myxococcus sp. RHSTA-1-4]|uniref:MXAN_5187 C-terminal domain-containing protein n=1 Tax=Myxococcus sp. RHSTA-1-4 TaxID=2874601 RepID=UPI001CBD7ACE|nr:MXAN_5187 C-terminal domain-containing protein [Myxococcus sp. RHSTA-1-4]MBZ4420804.1 hypothetical protein [Myxococcus sp. RHSTA-1-4]
MPPPEPRQAAAKNAAKNAAKPQGDSGSSENVLQECEALEAELASLRNLYEQYFLGNERQAPSRAHEDFKKRMMRLKGAFIRSTSAKFRVAGLHNKFLTYERLWVRTLQEIEAGTYKRDLFKARRRADSRKGASPGKDAQKGVVELPEDISDMDFEEVEELVRPRPANEPPLAGGVAAPFPSAPAVAPVTAAPAVAPVTGIPSVAPGIAPLTPPAGGTPFRGTPAVAPLSGIPSVAPAVPSVAPAGGTPARGLPVVTSPLGGTPARGTAVVPPGMAAKPAATPGAVPPARPLVPPGAAARTPTPGVAAAPPRPPAAAGSGGMSDDKLRAVYDAYVTAKRRCQEDTSKLSFESVAATLRKQVPELLKQHNAKAVEFKVVIKDGKASLKAVPK